MREDCDIFIEQLTHFALHEDTGDVERQAAIDAADAVGNLLDVVFGS